MKNILFILSFVILTSCIKDKVEHPFAGTYECSVTRTAWDMTGANTSSTQTENYEVKLVKDSIDVLGVNTHVNEIVFGKTFSFGYAFNNMNFRFEEDSLYISTFRGSSGGNNTITYKGRKIN